MKTMIYGSGAEKEAAAREKVPEAHEEAKPNEMMVNAQKMLSNPLTAPLAPLAMIVASIQEGGGIGAPMAARRFSDRGALVQTMSTRDLDNKNIFGAGGSN